MRLCARCRERPAWSAPPGAGVDALAAGTLGVCDACLDEMDPAESAAEREVRAHLERRAAERRRRDAEIPQLLADVRLDGLTVAPAAIDSARRWVAGDPPGLVLTGEVGTGKTHSAAAAANELLERDRVWWASAPALLVALNAGWSSPQRARAQRVVLGHSALVLDDLDKARPTPTGAEAIFAAIDGRITAGAPLLVTTNLALGELAAHWPTLGEAVASRLAGYCAVVEMGGDDRRLGS